MFSPRDIPPQYLYPGIVVAILLMSIAAHVVLVIKASSDGGAHVVPDYYEKAEHWDADQARAAAIRDGRAVSTPSDAQPGRN
jgi:hypothetical protein